MKRFLFAAAAAAAFSAFASAGEPAGMDHSKMDHSKMQGMDMKMEGMDMKPQGDQSPSSKAFNDVNMKMHKDMSITFSGDADADFIKGMMPHHQGAIDMAKVVLQYGKDPETKKLAEEIIKAQESEIAMMKAWLAKKGK
jgi:uncharacterized protein (DUF305 family)